MNSDYDINFNKLEILLYDNSKNTTIDSIKKEIFEDGSLKIIQNFFIINQIRHEDNMFITIGTIFELSKIKLYKVYQKSSI
jgi:hypothetical protein